MAPQDSLSSEGWMLDAGAEVLWCREHKQEAGPHRRAA